MTKPAPHATTHCSAKSKQTGNPCGAHVAHGFTVCYWHGARSPQAKASAEERMQALVHPAVSALQQLIAENDLAAAKYVLDYAGFKATEKVQQDGDVTLKIELVDRPQLQLAPDDAYGNRR